MNCVQISKRFLGVAAAVAVAAGLIAPEASAQSLKEKALSGDAITIGIHNQVPWGFKTPDGGVAGVHPDMIRAVLEPLGVKKIDFVVVDFGALIPSLISKRIDAVASGLAITPQRCEQVIFSEPDLAIGDGVLVKKGNPLNIHSYDDIAKNAAVRMAGGRGSSNTENAIKAGIPKDRVQQFQDVQAGVAALMAGRIDAITFSAGTAIGVLQDPNIQGIERATPFTGLVIDGEPIVNYAAIAFRPEDAALRDLYNEGLRKMKAEGKLKAILAKSGFSETEIAPDNVKAKDLCGGNYR
ncbi:ectoine/hydroxyectoine ABC transporter substrate-binding protein EhuB [Neorhizobium galegae]|uniref:ectoine/hydroxyectoine ABC transporter substrate-binding protein EhuB n=1 Tax=Neorhizobium galegae TaxID=399 RepID=UPI0006213F6C|nr:ectoine/hydroxyectoine ABC transporter substrate-binding protein EhuB [Neorhizobium galegae]CDZ64580.1 Ectoine/hydroxyectoine ABC transporter solute-binding protein [Neorhizobium galegae bv. orientalis]KAB1119968.1 ectoine/hydroxyectoine ABC transporter substrate-binding protein EhuB [Neorhizobium galegae]MCQ1575286.1 ectoine/hydroxyectoine ABC transporter substrate-binding protein EhuB [Neorhizobium galegae]MCQ1808953.1 ectoine/hydroxyectoine ABC transporter substrate-binding protein EhuB [